MKYTVVNTQDCRKIWAGKTGNKWFYIPRGAAGQQNINHRDVVGDIPKKKQGFWKLLEWRVHQNR